MNKYLKHSITLILCIFFVTGYSGPSWSVIDGDDAPAGKWGDSQMGTPGGTVTWSLIPTGIVNEITYPGTFTALNEFNQIDVGWEAQIASAFNAWSSVANIDFEKVDDNGAPFNSSSAVGDIRIGGHIFDGAYGTLAHGYYPPPNGISAAGDIHLDIKENWATQFSIYTVMTHEIGHAIGLGHSTNTQDIMYHQYNDTLDGPQQNDIEWVQSIYGARTVAPEPLSSSLFVTGTLFFYFRKRFKKV